MLYFGTFHSASVVHNNVVVIQVKSNLFLFAWSNRRESVLPTTSYLNREISLICRSLLNYLIKGERIVT